MILESRNATIDDESISCLTLPNSEYSSRRPFESFSSFVCSALITICLTLQLGRSIAIKLMPASYMQTIFRGTGIMSQGEYFFYCFLFKKTDQRLEESEITSPSLPPDCKPAVLKHIFHCDLKSCNNNFSYNFLIFLSCAGEHPHTLKLPNKCA